MTYVWKPITDPRNVTISAEELLAALRDQLGDIPVEYLHPRIVIDGRYVTNLPTPIDGLSVVCGLDPRPELINVILDDFMRSVRED